MRKIYLSLALAFAAAQCFSATLFVNVNAAGSNNGTNWANAYTNLQAAINASAAGDQIWVAAGTYFPTQLRIAGNPRSASFFINKNIKIYGGFTGSETALSQRDFSANVTVLSGDFNQNDIDTNGNGINDFNGGENAYTIVFFHNVTSAAQLDGFKVTGANADGTATYTLGTVVQTNTGGGIYNLNSSAILNNLKLTNNKADFGGGVYNSSSPATLNNSEVNYNFASYGAGSYSTQASVFTINNCDFFFNRFTGGTLGAVNNSVLKINNSDIAYNSGQYGGGVYLNTASANLYNVKISNNTATSSGGGIYNVDYGVATMYNTLINNNSASSNGGGIYNNDNSYAKLTNTTITGNSAGVRGGGIFNEISPDNLDTRIYNSIVWGNTAVTQGPSIYYTFYAQEDVHIRNSIIAGSGGSAAWNSAFGDNDGGNFAQDPLFVNAANENYTLQTGSVGIDSGYNQFLMLPSGANSWTAADADPNGYSRLQGLGVDMGAFETGGVLDVPIAGAIRFAMVNPVSAGQDIIIRTSIEKEFVLKVFSVSGQLVGMQRYNPGNPITFASTGLPEGNYFLKINSADNEIDHTLKAIIN